MRRILTGLPLALVTLVLGAGVAAAGGGGGALCAGYAEGDRLVMRDNCFEGTAHRPAGTTLEVVNDGHLPHTLTAADGSFDTGVLQAGESAELELPTSGEHVVYCTLHGTPDGGGMAGLLTLGPTTVAPAAAEVPTSGGDGTPPWVAVSGWVAAAVALGALAYARRRAVDEVPASTAS